MATRAHDNFGKVWTLAEINADCDESKRLFRVRRTHEPLVDYLEEFPGGETAANFVIDSLPELLNTPTNHVLLARIVGNKALFTALRYLAAPPISKDDLNTILGRKVSGTAVRGSVTFAEEIISLLRETIDPKRFSWIGSGNEASDAELNIAKIATAVTATIQRVQTKRRTDEKKELEGAVIRLLEGINFTKVPAPQTPIDSTEDLPRPSEFMTGATLGNDNGDCVIRLYDRRWLVLECKSSNSEINSRKRLNKEVVKDAENWKRQFGRQILTAAALRGVFKPSYVHEAQETPVMILWSHRLEDLQNFIESTRT